MTQENLQGINSKDSNVTISNNTFNFGSSEQNSKSNLPSHNLSTSGGEAVPFENLEEHKSANLVVLKIHF